MANVSLTTDGEYISDNSEVVNLKLYVEFDFLI